MDDTDTGLLQALMRGFDRAMLVSRYGEGLRSRPTTVANTGDGEHLWLLCGVAGDALDELQRNTNVNVVMQDETRFCCVSGTAKVARASGDEPIWSDDQRAWLARGARSSRLLLIEVAPQYAEYWDRSGLRGLRFATASGATLTGQENGDTVRRATPSREHRDNVIFLEQERWKR